MEPFGAWFTCRHGNNECMGNWLQLCVRDKVPAEKNYDWLVKFLVKTYDGTCSYYPWSKMGVDCVMSAVR